MAEQIVKVMVSLGQSSLTLATSFGGWEVVLILLMVLILLLSKRLPEIMRGMRSGMSEFRKAADREAEDAGRSAGGILGRPAAEALTPDNLTAELYDPAAFHRHGSKWSIRWFLSSLWRCILKILRRQR